MIQNTRSWPRIVAVIAPLTLAIVELFHPHPHDLLNLDLTRWMAMHYAQLVLRAPSVDSRCASLP
jgi:hypothetical protein